MNIQTVCRTLVLGALVAVTAPSALSLAQPKDGGVTTPNQTGVAAPNNATVNTNTNPHKHRYWRHRGGKHPHYGSRRVRT
ncbi:hypothetical protein AYJ54_34680 [Bradyrhizobium centrolobii]|uniref:Uncharacterized protein n=1 Tax=Bradyrhizobium centrolobii TaxID=1505087 RepID=A0A176Y854_9BRAD|nr:hypothetical protein [Bradyrhizobium centrolobii]OAE97722.1 hypothetical protein AYJ54_34680 [Bradyrhizobium centrolobii]